MFSRRTDWPLAPNRLAQTLQALRQSGARILDLTESNPTRCGFVYPAQEVLASLADARSLSYQPDPRGLVEARLAVTEYYAERGVQIAPEQVFLTTSTSEAYSFAFRLLADPGDNVAAPQPSYPLLDFLARLDSLELVPYCLVYDAAWRLDFESLRTARTPRTRAIVVIHPNNPTGSFVRPEEQRELVDLCSEWSVGLIADEVFADYAIEPGGAGDQERLATHAGTREVLTLTLSGLSKISGLPQMKLAWIVLSGQEECVKTAQARLELTADTYLSVSAPLAHALPKLLALRRVIQPQISERLRMNLRSLDAQLAAAAPVSRLKVEGGWYAILRLPSLKSDEDWAVELLREDGVLVHPGHFYDFASEGFIVLSLLPPSAIFEEGVSKILSRVMRMG